MPLESIVTANRFQGPVCSMKHQTNDQNEFTKLNKRMFLKKLELKIKILIHICVRYDRGVLSNRNTSTLSTRKT